MRCSHVAVAAWPEPSGAATAPSPAPALTSKTHRSRALHCPDFFPPKLSENPRLNHIKEENNAKKPSMPKLSPTQPWLHACRVLYLVAFVPWLGSSNIVALVSCVALVHFTVRATLEAILEPGAPGPHGDRPTVSRDLLPSCPCPPRPWGSAAGRGDGTMLGTDVGVDLPVVKRLFGAIWVISAMSSRCFCFGDESWHFSLKPSCAVEMLPGSKKEGNPWSWQTGSGSFSFFLPIWEGEAGSFGSGRLGHPWTPLCPSPAPQRSAPAEAAFNALSPRVDSVVPSLIV